LEKIVDFEITPINESSGGALVCSENTNTTFSCSASIDRSLIFTKLENYSIKHNATCGSRGCSIQFA